MGFKDLREFIERVESFNELRRVKGANCDLEIGAITEVAAASPACPMLVFDDIKGCKPGCRIVTNLLHTQRRMAIALGESPDLRGVGLVKKLKELLGNITEGPPPVEVKNGPVTENIITGKDVSVLEFPAVKWHELDGGPYFTGGVTVTRDPDEGWVNLGIYRMQIQDESTLSLQMEPGKHGQLIAQKYWARGKSCPVAVSLGHMPALFIAATLMVPWGFSEYNIAGQLNGAPIEVIPGELTGLPVPATAEVVLEGEVPPPEVESRVEGPWGEAIGYYASEPMLKPVIKVRAIMHRNSPIIQGAPPMKPFLGLKHFPVNIRCAAMWSDLEKCGIPDIQGVWEHVLGGLTVISLKQRYAGHAKQAALVARGSRSSINSRFIVTVDEDIDPCNIEDVMWALTTRCDPERDIEIIRDCWAEAIDPLILPQQIARKDITTTKVIANACKPIYRREAFPPVVSVSPELKAEVMKKWWNVIE
ncbi:UbiD family decarboxylase [Chloroflexota bacterium]